MAANQRTSRKTSPDGSVGPQVFRSVTAIIVWWAWVLFAVGNLIDLAVQGHDRLSLVAAAILLLVTGIAYVTAQRPRVISDDDGITVRNPLRDHHIPWQFVARVDLADLLRVHCRPNASANDAKNKKSRIISAWAVHYSRRRQMTSDMRARRQAARTGIGSSPFGVPRTGYARTAPARTADNSPEAEAERIARLLNDRATAAGIEQATAEASAGQAIEQTVEQIATGGGKRVASRWNWLALAAVIVPAILLTIVAIA